MLLLLLACLLRAEASPISTGSETIPTIAHTIIWGIESRSDCSITERTMFSIVRGCLLTIAACVYRAIHQNIPDPKASWWERQMVRMKITFYAVITPEVVIWWAMRQWWGAKKIADKVNKMKPELEWTPTHGHFAQMGGFGCLDNQRVLHPPTFIELLKNGQIDIEELKRVSKKKIDDSSKGDILSKGIVASQTTWFMFECLTRLHQRLPLLELEVLTLAFAVLNTLTYLFWWHKPLDVLCPIYLRIQPLPTPTPASRSESPQAADTPSEDFLDDIVNSNRSEENSRLLDDSVIGVKKDGQVAREIDIPKRATVQALSRVGHAIMQGAMSVMRAISTTVRVGAGIFEEIDHKMDGKNGGYWLVQKWVIKIVLWVIVGPYSELFGDERVDVEATHVSVFYAVEMPDEDRLTFLLALFITVCFGAMHLLSWNSTALPRAQLLLWRISSMTLVVEPLCALIEAIPFGTFPSSADSRTWHKRIMMCLCAFGFLGVVSYILARFCLIVLAFISLRYVPDTAFQVTSWTAYIPHI